MPRDLLIARFTKAESDGIRQGLKDAIDSRIDGCVECKLAENREEGCPQHSRGIVFLRVIRNRFRFPME